MTTEPNQTEPSEDVGTRLLFENERVRVWDFALAPGEAMHQHVHRLPYFFLVTEGGRLRITDPNDSDAPASEVEYHKDQITWVPVGSDGVVHNVLTNVGERPYRNFVVELKP